MWRLGLSVCGFDLAQIRRYLFNIEQAVPQLDGFI
jgi:hypothetical protein